MEEEKVKEVVMGALSVAWRRWRDGEGAMGEDGPVNVGGSAIVEMGCDFGIDEIGVNGLFEDMSFPGKEQTEEMPLRPPKMGIKMKFKVTNGKGQTEEMPPRPSKMGIKMKFKVANGKSAT